MRRFLRENGLVLVAIALFVGAMVGEVLTGHRVHNAELEEHHRAAMTVAEYVTSGAFVESIFENWESEFLQGTLYVLLTKFLRQRGAKDSKPLDGPDESDEDPRAHATDPNAPWPVRRGGLVLVLYEHSLSIALGLLFLGAFLMHGIGGATKYNHDAARHATAAISTFRYFGTAQFWFESFQNWQSEFMSIAVLVTLSISLRERGSPQSKPVAAP